MKRSSFKKPTYEQALEKTKKAQERARKRNKNEWSDVIIKYLGGVCVYCDSRECLNIHHIQPLYVGGKNEMGNLELVCQECHRELHKQWEKLHPLPKRKNFRACIQCDSLMEYFGVSKGFSKYHCEKCNTITELNTTTRKRNA